jgi:hypothetical protein
LRQHPAQGLHHSALALGTFGGGQLLGFGGGVGTHGIQNLEMEPSMYAHPDADGLNIL